MFNVTLTLQCQNNNPDLAIYTTSKEFFLKCMKNNAIFNRKTDSKRTDGQQ